MNIRPDPSSQPIKLAIKSGNWINDQRMDQARHFAEYCPNLTRYKGLPYCLIPDDRAYNLPPSFAELAARYFEAHGIVWHIYASHGLSSQACCLNFLLPLYNRPEMLARIVEAATGWNGVEALPIEMGPDGEPWFVGFEWTGKADYLNEWPKGKAVTRGANATSADAALRVMHDGVLQTILIEWKYTETYGAPLYEKGNPTRIDRYKKLAFAPDGPIVSNKGLAVVDFFWEPAYQLLRQQMLAKRMEQAREDDVERVSVLHLSPSGNRKLHTVTAPDLKRFGTDIFDVFSELLVEPDRFVCASIEAAFGPLLKQLPDDPWSKWLLRRYKFLSSAVSQEIP